MAAARLAAILTPEEMKMDADELNAKGCQVFKFGAGPGREGREMEVVDALFEREKQLGGCRSARRNYVDRRTTEMEARQEALEAARLRVVAAAADYMKLIRADTPRAEWIPAPGGAFPSVGVTASASVRGALWINLYDRPETEEPCPATPAATAAKSALEKAENARAKALAAYNREALQAVAQAEPRDPGDRHLGFGFH